jgi:hypothetical protein
VVAVSTIQVTPEVDTLSARETSIQFAATAVDTEGGVVQGATFTWTSSDPSVASVDDQGLATAIGPGECRISATAGGAQGMAELVVMPRVEGPDPSYRVGAFYYGWYGNPEINGHWNHWQDVTRSLVPPDDISSDYYPLLGPYSAMDPVVLAQHMAWLRQAGIGVLIQTWWGMGAFSDQAVTPILDAAAEYGVKVAFHLEPFEGRSVDGVVEAVQYIYDRYGSHPAFFRTNATSRWSPDGRPKGLFFFYAPAVQSNFCEVDCPGSPEYWQPAIDALHALPDGAFVIGHMPDGEGALNAHFDGAYDYVTLRQGEELNFDWAWSLPVGIHYVPAVAPGFSARRIGYAEDTYLPRLAGETFHDQWEAAVEPGIEPFITVVTSFNEWHEGSQIEPVMAGKNNGSGYNYPTYGPLQTDGYLTLTRELAEEFFLSRTWTPPSQVRVRVATSSDWTWVRLKEGARWGRPEIVSVSQEAVTFSLEDGYVRLHQALPDAVAGQTVEGVLDLGIIGPCTSDPATLEIGRGHLGETSVRLSRNVGGQQRVFAEFLWADLNLGDSQNTATFQISCEELFEN